MPVIALAPENELAEKLISNLEEVKARGGKLYVVGNAAGNMKLKAKNLINLPECDFLLTPILVHRTLTNSFLRSSPAKRYRHRSAKKLGQVCDGRVVLIVELI